MIINQSLKISVSNTYFRGVNGSKKTDSYPNLVKYSPDVLKKKTKVLDIINMDKTCFMRLM